MVLGKGGGRKGGRRKFIQGRELIFIEAASCGVVEVEVGGGESGQRCLEEDCISHFGFGSIRSKCSIHLKASNLRILVFGIGQVGM